ncbi:uncharacterized protein LOC110982854 [Acanthaster planci]|uniref:Uncharacterized protein LOC110982854 n=1 Tax=Acanthaster planci TaxID=133434 RepID=A0A8B7YXP9_ACAPL|nr:uncharacterized protein LOC110982854 [Acanthaster planci]XP_022097265.1 uncharacterized protein LOC110982854 [Acanthaster planci]
MGDMDDVKSRQDKLGDEERGGIVKGHVASERPGPEGEDAVEIDRADPLGGNCTPRTSSVGPESEEHTLAKRDKAVRKGSAGSHRSRHGSGGSRGSRNRSRSRSRHKSHRNDSANSRHSPANYRGHKMAVNGDGENGTTTDEDDQACSVVHVHSFTLEDDGESPRAGIHQEDAGRNSKRTAKMGKKLMMEKQKYVTEKHLLKAKMDKARKQFEEEVAKYERELDGKRQEMQTKLSDLHVDEQYAALSQRMEELAGFRDELDSRFQQCVEYEQEIEEIERYLDRRQELCNSKEEDLRLLDDQLDTLHQELEWDKERLERAGFDVNNLGPRNRASGFRSQAKGTDSDADDYILKANLRKCQSDLKTAEQTLQERDLQLARAKEEILSLQTDKKKDKEKIKQLETQLSVALSQLKNQSNLGQASLASSATLNRQSSIRSHVSLDRFKSPTDLSINQQAQLNRSMSGKEKSGGGGKSPAGKKYPSSTADTSPANTASSGGGSRRRRHSSVDGAAREGDATLDLLGRPRSWTADSAKSQPRTISSACAIM